MNNRDSDEVSLLDGQLFGTDCFTYLTVLFSFFQLYLNLVGTEEMIIQMNP